MLEIYSKVIVLSYMALKKILKKSELIKKP